MACQTLHYLETSKVTQHIGVVFLIVYLLVSATVCSIVSWPVSMLYCIGSTLSTVFFFKPKAGIYLLLFLTPVTTFTCYITILEKWNFIVGNVNQIDLIPAYTPVVIISCVGFLFAKLEKTSCGETFFWNPIQHQVVLLLIYAGTTILWSEAPFHSLFQFSIFVMNAVIFIMIVEIVNDSGELKKILWIWLLSISFQAVFSLVSFFFDTTFLSHKFILHDFSTTLLTGFNFFGGFLQDSGDPQVASGLQDHHETALLMNMTVPLTVGLFLIEKRKIRKGLLLFLGFLLAFVTLRTESRAGFGALVIMCCLLFLFVHTLRKHFLALFFILLLGLTGVYMAQQAGISLILDKNITPRLIFLGSEAIKSGDAIDPNIKNKKHSRRRLYANSFKAYLKVPLQGFGAGNLKKKMDAPHAHSIFFSLILDFGLPGFLFVIYLIQFFGRQLYALLWFQSTRHQVLAVCLITGLVGICIHGLVDFEYNTTTIWVYMGLLTASLKMVHHERSRSVSLSGFRNVSEDEVQP